MQTLPILLVGCSFVAMAAAQTTPTLKSARRELASSSKNLPPSHVDFAGFLRDSADVARFREQRLVDLDTFLRMARDDNTIILDTRSQAAFNKQHLQGAVHLNFSDFTAEKLGQVIPNKTTRVLIYCNNNLAGDEVNFAMKKITLALNIPTFINLHGYGYENLYELSSLVPIDDASLKFAGTDVPDEREG